MEKISSCDDLNLLLNIPQDVLIQILVLLPVISLLRFKSVCKSWRALIQSPLFIDLHLNTTTTTNNNNNNNNFGTFIFQTSGANYAGSTRESEAFMLSGGSGSGSGEEEELKLEDLGFPSRYKVSSGIHTIFMVGSCNGLICLHDTKRRDVSLWNPATRQFRLLPKSLTLLEEAGIPAGDLKQDFVAFGYDVKTKDYKVVQISHFKPYTRWLSVKKYIFRVQVYSLTTDSWRLLEAGINNNSFPALPNQAIGLNHGVYLNGSYYFLGCYLYDFAIQDRDYLILSFDFTKEIITIIQLPHDHHHPHTISTYQLGEKLAVFAKVAVEENESDCDTYEIWVLNEHGVKEEEESWTKLHVLYSSGRPRGISNNGEFAFIGNGSISIINGVFVYSGNKLELFNLVTREVKKEFPTPQEVIRADVYKQSLVSIGGNGTTYDWVIGGAM